ncbi:MAG TPA: pyroglutamyl-peptidase I [Xanthobacteraceae bacterium]
MSVTILITGFGPFPGAPFNPTGVLAEELVRRRHPAFINVRRIAHVFQVSYDAVDRELPGLLASERPDALIMFGLATRSNHVRIETRARNTVARAVPDVAGNIPFWNSIRPGGPTALPLRTPAQRLLMAVRATGVPVAISHDAGDYLCNYLCWRAAEAGASGSPRLMSFVHVPQVARSAIRRLGRGRLSLDALAAVSEAIVRAAIPGARSLR